MNEWLTPYGLVVILGLIVFVAMPFIARLLRLAGKSEAATTVEELQKRAALAEAALGSVVAGVNDARKAFSPETAAQLVKILRERNQAMGVEEVVAPVVNMTKAGVEPPQAAHSAIKAAI